MKITGVTTAIVPLAFRNAVMTRVEVDDGHFGVSEVVLKRRSRTVAKGIDEAGRTLLGRDPRQIETLYEEIYRDSFWVGGPLHATPISALEMALWDWNGKRLGVPVHELFGGPTRPTVPVYGHVPAGGSPEAFADHVEDARAVGHHTVKTTLPLFYGEPDPDWLAHASPHGYSGAPGQLARTLKETERVPTWVFDRIAEYFAAARQRVGQSIDIAVDCHGRLNLANAKRLCAALEPFELLFVEEPLPPELLAGAAELKRSTPIPIAAGERIATVYGARDWLEQEAVSIWQPDFCNCGGYAQGRRIAALAEAHGIGLAPHNPNGPLATMQGVQMGAALPNFTILETIGTEADRQTAELLCPDPPRIEQGAIAVPSAPGVGLEVHESIWELGHDAAPFEGWR